MKKLLTTLVFLMIISVTIPACNANDESPAEKNFIMCTGKYFDDLAKCNATESGYLTEYDECSQGYYTQMKTMEKACKGSSQEQMSCRLEAMDQYLQNIAICTSKYHANLALVAKCQEDAKKAYVECKEGKN
jgi:hypothetical protein